MGRTEICCNDFVHETSTTRQFFLIIILLVYLKQPLAGVALKWTRRLINCRNQLHQSKAGDCHRNHSFFFSSWQLSLTSAEHWWLWSQESYHFLRLKIAGQAHWLACPSWTQFQTLTRIHPSLSLLCNWSTPTSFPATILPLYTSIFLLVSMIKLIDGNNKSILKI